MHLDATPDQIRTFHSAAVTGEGGHSRYDATALEELPARYERPNDRNRWERPLFVIRPDDDSEAVAQIFGDVIAAVDGHELKPNLATVQQPVAGPTRRAGGGGSGVACFLLSSKHVILAGSSVTPCASRARQPARSGHGYDRRRRRHPPPPGARVRASVRWRDIVCREFFARACARSCGLRRQVPARAAPRRWGRLTEPSPQPSAPHTTPAYR